MPCLFVGTATKPSFLSQDAKTMTSGSNQADLAQVVVFSINPNSGASDQRALCDSIARRLESLGYMTILSSDLKEVESSTRKHLESGSLRAVVAAGGDGTISLLANRLPRETPFAILPLGTENLLGRHLGLKADENFFVSLIQDGIETRIDAGNANGKLFFVVCSCGFDAAVVKRLDEVRSGHINRASWLKPIWDTVLSYRFPALKYSLDDQPAVTVRWAFIFNIPRYAIGLRITPEANDSDGKLDICSYRDHGIIRGIWYLLVTFLGSHSRLDATQFGQFEKLCIEAEGDEPVYYELDGDPGGELPLKIDVEPGALRVLIPAASERIG
jgi:diacylglycerol kinase family enzyme